MPSTRILERHKFQQRERLRTKAYEMLMAAQESGGFTEPGRVEYEALKREIAGVTKELESLFVLSDYDDIPATVC